MYAVSGRAPVCFMWPGPEHTVRHPDSDQDFFLAHLLITTTITAVSSWILTHTFSFFKPYIHIFVDIHSLYPSSPLSTEIRYTKTNCPSQTPSSPDNYLDQHHLVYTPHFWGWWSRWCSRLSPFPRCRRPDSWTTSIPQNNLTLTSRLPWPAPSSLHPHFRGCWIQWCHLLDLNSNQE